MDVQHDIRRLIAHLVTTEALPLLQTTMDAARAAMGIVIHRDHAENREFYLARLDFVLDSAPWPIAPVASHTVVEHDGERVVRRLSVEQAYHASKLPPAALLHEAMRALARGDALAAAAAVDEAREALMGDAMTAAEARYEAQALLGGEAGACRGACERLPDAAEEVGEVDVTVGAGCGL